MADEPNRDPSVWQDIRIGPSAHVTGIYASVDLERGVQTALVNEVVRLRRIGEDVTKRDQEVLSGRGINALRFFPGRRNLVSGGRTLASDATWKYVNVRRLLIFLEESIHKSTQWVLFEPNAEPLWTRVRRSIVNFLTTAWRSVTRGVTFARSPSRLSGRP